MDGVDLSSHSQTQFIPQPSATHNTLTVTFVAHPTGGVEKHRNIANVKLASTTAVSGFIFSWSF